LSARNYTGRGIFSEDGIIRMKFYRGGDFFVGGTFQEGVSREGREFFMKGEPYLLALF
jgi:hypothetical protein